MRFSSNLSRRWTAARLGILSLLVLLGWAVAFPPATGQALRSAAQIHGQPTDRLVLRYNPYDLSDQDFANLAKALAEITPVELWPTIKVKFNEGLLGIVDRAYDFFLSSPWKYSDFAAPQTALDLSEIIKKANDLGSDTLEVGQVLRIPPMIPRPQSEIGRGDPTKVVHVTQSVDTGATFYSDQGPPSLAHGITPERWQVSDFNQLGIRDAQEVSLSLPPSQAQFLVASGIGHIVPWKRVNVELLQSSECTDAFPPSPYIEQARLRLEKNLEGMTRAATKIPLVLVDYDFEGGHGAQVRKVVDDLLAELGVPSLRAYVLNFDLNARGPTTVRETLLKSIGEYASYLENRLNVDYGNQRANAAEWVAFPDDPLPGRPVVPIAPFALQAAVAVNLEAGAWLNLSWRGGSPDQVMPVELRQLLQGNEVFAVVAAGNELADIMSDRAPQSGALSFRQFVNVTNGTAKGEVCGSRTSEEEGGRVHLLAQGLSVDAAQKRVSGSSFASPVVATAAWLKHLIDGTPALRMRQQLVSASSFMPALNTRTVTAKGVFDPARLLANPGPHYIVAGTGEAMEFQTMELDLGSCGSFRVEGTEAVKDLVIYERAGKHEVAVRTVTGAFDHVKEREACEVPSLRFSMTLLSGETRMATTPKGFLEMVRQLHF